MFNGGRGPLPVPKAAPPKGLFGGLSKSIGNAGRSVGQATHNVQPHTAPQAGSDVQSTHGYDTGRATAFKQTPAYKQTVVSVFKSQPVAQKQAILNGALRTPTHEGQIVLNFVKQTLKSNPFDESLKGLTHGGAGTDVLGTLGHAAKSVYDLSNPLSLRREVSGQTSTPADRALAPVVKGAGNVLGALGKPSEMQKLTAKIGGATSPQDVLKVGAAVGSRLIDAIPTRQPNGPGEQIAAQQAGMLPGGIGKNAAKNVVNLTAEAFPSMAIPVNEALHNHWGQAFQTFTQPYAQTFGHGLKGFQKAAYNDPVTAYLLASGFLHPGLIAGDTAQSLVRGKGIPNITPESVHLTADLSHERPNFSRNPLIRSQQKAVQGRLYGRNALGELVPRSDTVRARLVRLETSRMVGQHDRVRSVHHAQEVHAHAQDVLQHRVGRAVHATKTTLKVDPQPALIKGANVLTLVAKGVVSPKTWVADLNRVIEMVSANRPHLEGADLVKHDAFVKELKLARDKPPNAAEMKRVERAATNYAEHYNTNLEPVAHEMGHLRDMSTDALTRAKYKDAFITHVPGARMDPELGVVVDHHTPGGVVTRPVSTAEMVKAVDQHTGGRQIAFVSDKGMAGDAAHYVNQEVRPAPVPAKANTAYNFTHGLTDPSHEAMLEQRVKTRGIIDAHHAQNRLDQQLVTVAPNGQGWTSFGGAKKDALPHQVPIRLAPVFHPPASLAKALNADHVDMTALHDEAASRSLDIASRLHETSEPGQYGLIDKNAADQLRAHQNLISPNHFYRGWRSLNNQFRKVALATSFRHLPGVVQEVAIRSAMSGVGPISLLAGRAVLRRSKEIDPRLGEQRQIEHKGGMQVGQAMALQTRSVARHFEGTLLHPPLNAFERAMRYPGARQASTLWHAWMRFTLQGTKHFLEEQTGVAALGKHAIQKQGGMLGLIGGGLRTWGKMVDQAAHGILDEKTSRQMGAYTRRIYGRWTDLTPGEQSALMFSPFGMWWTNSVAWLARMPVDHPMGAAFQAALNQGTEKQRQAMGLDMFSPNHLPLYKQGGIALPGGDLLNMNYYSPVGVINDPAATAASLIAPWAEPVIVGLFGKDWLLNPITSPKNPKGRTGPTPGDVASVILGSLASSFLPLYQKAQTLVQGGASSYATSSLLSPQTKGKNPGLLEGLKKDVMPLRISRASNGATSPTGTGGSGHPSVPGFSSGSGGNVAVPGFSGGGGGNVAVPGF